MQNKSIKYEILVIGAGVAGMSAAVTLKQRNKKIAVIASDIPSKKLIGNHKINNYLGLNEITASELGRKAITHVKSLDIEFIESRITAVYFMGDNFQLKTHDNKTLVSKAVIVATGINFDKSFPGEKKFLGKGVSYCATCDGMIYKGKKIAVIGQCNNANAELNELKFLSGIADKIIYIPNKNADKKLDTANKFNNVITKQAKHILINGDDKVRNITLDSKAYNINAVFIIKDNASPDQLIFGLEINDRHIKVDQNMLTNINGCFACGDITGKPYQYIKAAGQGNIAALSAVKYIDNIN